MEVDVCVWARIGVYIKGNTAMYTGMSILD